MRALVLVVLCALGATVAAAQDTAIVIQPESAGIMVPPPELPHAVGEDAVRRYNAPTTTRLVGRARLPHGNEWRGDVAVRNGTVAGAGPVGGRPGVFRTAGDFTGKRSDLGYLLRTELRAGETPAYGIEFRAFDDVTPVEDWGLRAGEVGWAAFLFQRDYRDYYLSKGIAVRAFVQPERSLRLDIDVRADGQSTVRARDPWTVFRNDQAWRPNPPIDDGHYTTLAGTVTFDTRNDRLDPTAGWFLRARFENSRSEDVTPQTGVPAAVRGPIPTDGSYAFSRLFVDFRRYPRVSPSERVTLRVFAGGWIGGDPLPLQQRLSIGAPDPLTGYGFRQTACNGDIIDPAFAGTRLAACDRVILAQAEYRGHLSLHWPYGSWAPDAEAAKSVFTLQGRDPVALD